MNTPDGPRKRKHGGFNGKTTPSPAKQDKVDKTKQSSFFDDLVPWIPLILTFLAAYVRLWRIDSPNHVVFDEVHFGGFANQYLKGTFHVDVHPPLAKLLITAAAKLGGYDGNFSFKEIGLEYPSDVPYIRMRLLGGVLGVLTVPLAYKTMRNLGAAVAPSLLAALMVMWDNALTAQSRLILLDSPLIFFTCFTIFAWSKFFSLSDKPFTTEWLIWLLLTGVGLGGSVSSKWVGLFVIAMVGVATLKSLFDIYSDKNNDMETFARHFATRAIALILVPLSIYLFMFFLHLHILRNTGTGTGFISPELASTLQGSTTIQETVRDVAINSKIFIRHVATTGGYLHSHIQTYPTGSKQQQVTLYPYGDENSWWLVELASGMVPENETVYVKNGDAIRLLHTATGRHLHSHDHRPPVSDRDYQDEVSCYGNANHSDSNDVWIVEIKSGKGEAGERLQTFGSHFALRHQNRGCHLFSHNVKLPKWGFEQQEVTCGRGVLKTNTIFRVEANEHPVLSTKPEERIKIRKPNFFQKVLELQKVMFNVNNGLTSSHPFDSRPTSWPFLQRGISFWGSKDGEGPKKSIYLIGNPFVWKFGLIGLLVTPAVLVLRALVLQRGADLAGFASPGWVKTADVLAIFWIGWFLHWAPFFIMDRQLFLHHYLPALYISILLACLVLDRIPMPKRIMSLVCFAIAIVTWRTFVQYSPITYGYAWDKQVCEKSKKLKTWDYDCK